MWTVRVVQVLHTVEELFKRRSSDDFLFIFLVRLLRCFAFDIFLGSSCGCKH